MRIGLRQHQVARCRPGQQPAGQPRLGNGIQIFPGSAPIYRGNMLVGGIGVSGDGIDQDDMISFLGLNNGGARVGSVGLATKPLYVTLWLPTALPPWLLKVTV